jgi:tetratricopeptide (TPR) repeat protein
LTSDIRPRAPGLSPLLLFGLAALVSLLVYLPTLRYGFVWDDKALIVENPYLAEASIPAVFAHNYWYNPDLPATLNDKGYYRPLTTLTLMANRRISGLNPAPYHLLNLLLHAAVVFLLGVVLYRLIGLAAPAALGALAIGVNPALNSTVAWISGRNYLLAMLFLLVGLYCLLRGRKRDSRTPGVKESGDQGKPLESPNPRIPESSARLWRILFGCSLLLALLAHEAAIVFALIAGGWILLSRRLRPRLAWLLAVLAPVIAYFILRLGIARVPFVPGAVSDIISQPLVGLNSFGQEMLVLIVPFVQKVMYAAIPGFSVFTLLGVLFLGLLLYGAIWQMRRAKSASSSPKPKQSFWLELEAGGLGWLGFSWAIGFLLPFANLTSWGPSGRMLYLAGMGTVLVVLGLFNAKPQTGAMSKIIAVLACVYVVALGAWTVKRNAIWKDEETLYRATVREAPESQCAHLFRADSLQAAGQTAAAVIEYRAAIAADPDLVGAHFRLGDILYDLNDAAGAVEEYRELVRLNSSVQARRCLAQAWAKAGYPDSATVELREIVRRRPEAAGAHTELAINLAQRGRADSALAEFKLAARLDSGSAEAHNNLALAFRQAGMPDSAIREYEVSLALDPNSALTLNNLGSAQLARGNARAAIAAFRQALRLEPGFAAAQAGLREAYRMAGMPDSAAGVESGK